MAQLNTYNIKSWEIYLLWRHTCFFSYHIILYAIRICSTKYMYYEEVILNELLGTSNEILYEEVFYVF